MRTEIYADKNSQKQYPFNDFIKKSSIPSTWCSGCGIGIAVNAFIHAINKCGIDKKNICLLSSGIGCTGKIEGYLKLKTFSITKGNVINLAQKINDKFPELKVITFLNDTDFIANSIDNIMEQSRENKSINIIIVYINTYIYNVFVNKKQLHMTPFSSNSSAYELISPFNIPNIAKICKANYIARWTPLHPRRTLNSFQDVLSNKGYSVIEFISPCLIYYMSSEKSFTPFDRMKLYKGKKTVIKHNEPLENLDLRKSEEIIVGKFFSDKQIQNI